MSSIDEVYRRMNDKIELIQTEEDGGPSEIQEFYSGKTVFVTGVTGFLGKLLVEKLLRGCPQIRRIYVHVRGKRGLAQEEIMNRIIDNKVRLDLHLIKTRKKQFLCSILVFLSRIISLLEFSMLY